MRRPLRVRGLPRDEWPAGSKQLAGHGKCGACYSRELAGGGVIPVMPKTIATKVVEPHVAARRALAGDWVESAVCRSLDPDLWFSEAPSDVARAAAFCAVCPVKALCAERAEAAREQYGVWGGVKRNAKPERVHVVAVAA
ncbi:hypothetical protein GCM10025864_44810 [Luteimicrobium album]|uniref:Transcriptional regulator WhiB n=1 Tax=Luteimicrobium album TaxID=1054550 RepID=A0ABQ6I8H3_9MICO|nr:WhiB family transcriptional regulator [Luteimicrobium album]GMA26722.1 hypothetical protein GCM10025864_44810 [Luteimicrobium album]